MRAAVGLPLRKDFVTTAYQVWEARAWGADAVLLIVAALDPPALRALLDEAAEAGLDALVEVHTVAEATAAADAGATLVGVNARDLATLEVDPGRFAAVRQAVPGGTVLVAERHPRPGRRPGGRRRRRRRRPGRRDPRPGRRSGNAPPPLAGAVGSSGGQIGRRRRPPRRCLQALLEEQMAEARKILLGEDELPSAWFNIVPSMPTKPDPYLHPQTRQVGPDDLAPLFPMALIGQEVSTDEWVDIPGRCSTRTSCGGRPR